MSPSTRTGGDVVEKMRENASSTGEKTAIIVVDDPTADDARTVSYARLDAAARSCAAWLRRRFEPGERVLLTQPTGTNFATGLLGCLYAGMIAVPAPVPDGSGDNRRRAAGILRDAEASVILAEDADMTEVTAWAASVGGGRLRRSTVEETTTEDPDSWTPPATGRDAPALLQYTSGSTGDPSGVVVSHGNLLHNAGSLCRAVGSPTDIRVGGWGPMYHDMGLGTLLQPLITGWCSVLMDPRTFLRRPARWLRMIDEYDVRLSAAPDFAYDLCVRAVRDEQLAELDLSRWAYALNGSEPVNARTLEAFAERFAAAGFRREALCPVYGLAEATLYVCGISRRAPVVRRMDAACLERGELRATADGDRTLVSCGTTDDFDVRIVDPDTRAPLPEGRVGEVWLRGPSVTRRYWRRQGPVDAATADGDGGYLRTGDLGALYEGELHVTGRIKDLLVVNGRNLHPHDLERHARAGGDELIGCVGAAFAVTASGPGAVERIVLVHEVRGRPRTEHRGEIAATVRRRLTRAFGVRLAGVVLVRRGAVARTTSGKVRRSTMRDLFLAGALEPLFEDLDAAVREIPTEAGRAPAIEGASK